MARAVGIDLGTTNSVVAALEGGEATIIPNSEGSRTTPSVVAFPRDGGLLVGQSARNQAVTNVHRTIRSVKRHMGTDWTMEVDGVRYTPQEISARILQKLKRDAESYLGEEVTDAVITVPAYFEVAQRQATREAGEIAGLNVLRILNESTAAGLAYGLDKTEEEDTALVFDLGGGTADVSLLEIGDGVVEVKATHGDRDLGGDDWNERIARWLHERFRRATGIDLSSNRTAGQRLWEAAEQAKIELSSASATHISLPYLAADLDRNPLFLDEVLSRDEFESITSDLLDRCRTPFAQVVRDAGIDIRWVDHVVLVGGSTRMPALASLISELTGGRTPSRGVHPEEVVAVGACLQAGVLRGDVQNVLLVDVTPLSFGVETKGGVMTKLINRNTTIPTKKSEIFTPELASPDSTIPSAYLRPASPTPTPAPPPADPTPKESRAAKRARSKGESARTDSVAPPSTPPPAPEPVPMVHVGIYQGEREIAAYNRRIGELKLHDLTTASRVEVSVDIDGNGIVVVSAADLDAQERQKVTITSDSALSRAEIDRMMATAEAHAEDDRRRRERAERRDRAETLAHETDRFVSQHVDELPGDVIAAAYDALRALHEALARDDPGAITTASDSVVARGYELGRALYERRQTVIEAELVEPELATVRPEGEIVDVDIVEPGTEPDAAEWETTDLETTDLETTDPLFSDLETTDDKVTEPLTSGTTDDEPTDPLFSHLETTDPEPADTETAPTEPVTAEPTVSASGPGRHQRPRPSTSPRGIFISYRRSDSKTMANWLGRGLWSSFGNEEVFLDVRSIDAGLDFGDAIEAALDRSSVMLVVIGERWLSADDGEGRRLDDPTDWLRHEIEQGIARGLRVIPILVDGASMPAAADLPTSLRKLTQLQAAMPIRSEWFEHDFGPLRTLLEGLLL